MNPPWSMIFFTTLAGAAQGLLLALFGVDLAARAGLLAALPAGFFGGAVVGVLVLAGAGLVAASFHLGRPLRAWRAVTMWRTSWLSREVIALPAFIGATLLYGITGAPGWGVLAALLALLMYLCTGMIYAAVKAMREWATPMTPLNFALIGTASGLLLALVLAAAWAPLLQAVLAHAALAATLGAAAGRGATLVRSLRMAPKTTLQTAIGVRHPHIVPVASGAMAGSFSTREFMHGRGAGRVRAVRCMAGLCGFGLPALVLALAGVSLPAAALALLWAVQAAGLVAERWSFFVEARHPQNLYHAPLRR